MSHFRLAHLSRGVVPVAFHGIHQGKTAWEHGSLWAREQAPRASSLRATLTFLLASVTHPAPHGPLWARPCSTGLWLLLCPESGSFRPGGLPRAMSDVSLPGLCREPLLSSCAPCPPRSPADSWRLSRFGPHGARVWRAVGKAALQSGGWGPVSPAKGGTVTGQPRCCR